MKVAFVHDWLVGQRGGENVLLELVRLFPTAPIYTLVYKPGTLHPDIESHDIRPSYIQQLPQAETHFRKYLPLFPHAIEQLDLSGFDFIISTSHCVAKGVRLRPGQLHLSYIHTPMRYIWDELPNYVPDLPLHDLLCAVARCAVTPLRRWDVDSAQRPSQLIANSAYVAERIKRLWGRPSNVVYPPVECHRFNEAAQTRGDDCSVRDDAGYLVVSALVPYKRVDLAVRFAAEAKVPLTVVGKGSELSRLQALAGPTVKFISGQSGEELARSYANARALLFCGVEDFGIVPVEAMAAGCPVIARGKGGALETVVGAGTSPTGVFFDEPTVDSLRSAVEQFENARQHGAFRKSTLQARAAQFAREHFVSAMQHELLQAGCVLPP